MNAVAIIEPATTDIAVVVANNPGVVLVDTAKFDVFYEKLKADADALPVDLTTKKGRDAIASFAATVRSEKAAINKDRLRLTKEWRDLTSQVNEAWKGIEERLNGLAVDVRRPLTEWEQAEEKRVEECRAIIEGLKAAAVVTLEDTAETVRNRGAATWNTALDADMFRDMLAEAQTVKDAAVATLKSALARLVKEEADRVELDRLRAEAAEREERDRIEREAREAEEQRIAAEKAAEAKRIADEQAAEARRIAAEKAEAERIELAKQEAAEAEQRKAQEAQDKRDREHAEQLAAERAALEHERANAARIENERLAKEAHDRAVLQQLADEQAARDADQKHRGAVMKAAKQAIMSCGADEETAKKIVLLIRSGEVPNVTLRF